MDHDRDKSTLRQTVLFGRRKLNGRLGLAEFEVNLFQGLKNGTRRHLRGKSREARAEAKSSNKRSERSEGEKCGALTLAEAIDWGAPVRTESVKQTLSVLIEVSDLAITDLS
jgi:hypothetical protein